MGRQDDIVRASEIGQYAFCARAWWLGRVKGYRSTNVAAMREVTRSTTTPLPRGRSRGAARSTVCRQPTSRHKARVKEGASDFEAPSLLLIVFFP